MNELHVENAVDVHLAIGPTNPKCIAITSHLVFVDKWTDLANVHLANALLATN